MVLARRSGDKWYVAGVNATAEPLKLSLSLPMLTTGEVELYQNDQLATVKLSKKKVLKVEMPTNGGMVIVQ